MQYIFLDTNVLVDYAENRMPFAEFAEKIFISIEEEKTRGYISALSVATIYYLLSKNINAKFALRQVRKLMHVFQIIDLTKNILEKSINAEFKDFEDAIQHFSALSDKKIDFIITRNVRDYKLSSLPVLSPDVFVKHHLK